MSEPGEGAPPEIRSPRSTVRPVPGRVVLLGLLRGPRTSGLAALRPGPATIRGRVLPIDLVEDALGRQEAVYVRYVVDRWDSSPTVAGIGGKWVRVAADEVAAPFEVQGEDGAVLVDPAGARVVVPEVQEVVEEADGGTIRVTASTLRPGDDVVVAGELRAEAAAEAGGIYRGARSRLVLGGAPVILSARRVRRWVALRLLGTAGVGLVVVAAVVAALAW